MTDIIEIDELEALVGGDCYTFKVKLSIVIAQVEVTLSFGDCPVS